MALATGINVRIYKGAKTGTAMTGEVMTDSGDGLRFRVTNRSKRYFDDTATWVFYNNGVAINASDIDHVEYPGGEVVFKSSKTGRTITADGKYFVIDKTYMVKNIDQELSVNMEDVTAVGDTGARNYPTSGPSAKLALEGIHEDNTMFDRLGGKYAVVYSETGVYQAASITSGTRWEYYARVSSDKINGANPKGVLGDSITLESDGPVYYRSD